MIPPSRLYGLNLAEGNRRIRSAYALYEQLDNQPGDKNRQPDRVDIEGQGLRSQAVIERECFNTHFIDRVQSPDGSVLVREYNVSRLNPWANTNGFQVVRSPKGEFTGEEIYTHRQGFGPSKLIYTSMPLGDALQRFNALQVRFEGEFA